MLFLDKDIDLSPTEIGIYNYISANLDKVVYMRIRELANATFVSTSTILRFCQKFGCQGYADFKVKLLDYQKSIEKDHRLQSQDVQNELFDFFEDVYSQEMQENMNEAVRLILESDLLFFLGTDTSGIMAEYAANLFSSLFTFSCVIKEPQNCPEYLLPDYLNSHMCLIVLSQDEGRGDLIDYIRRMKAHHITIISISNCLNSEIVKLADLNIDYRIKISLLNNMDMQSQIPVMYILEKLSRLVYYYKHQQQLFMENI